MSFECCGRSLGWRLSDGRLLVRHCLDEEAEMVFRSEQNWARRRACPIEEGETRRLSVSYYLADLMPIDP